MSAATALIRQTRDRSQDRKDDKLEGKRKHGNLLVSGKSAKVKVRSGATGFCGSISDSPAADRGDRKKL